MKEKVPETEMYIQPGQPQLENQESAVEKEEEYAQLKKLVLELRQGGLVTEEGERLLPDEAVAQGVLPGHTAVKLMAQAGLFGGFLDASSSESLSMEDVMHEGLLDEDLMWSVLQSEKNIAGIVDVDKKQICGVREAAQAGLIDSNTAARLIEAQVASGGIVDLRRDKKVSVTLAAKLGLIEEDEREGLVALEKAYKGKASTLAATQTKANLQLQMEGVIDPESRTPVPLEQAIQKGIIRPEDAYQVLARQVAEGGIIHHASGMRLSVSDAVDRGLVDRSIAPGLEELEWVYQGKISPSSHPDAVVLQASTGGIYDPDSGRKRTLAEAVSIGLLNENIAREAMDSLTVTQGVLDPKTARVVPYSELVCQGKIDIETVEERIQQALEETLPQKVADKSGNLQEPADETETDGDQKQSVFRDSVSESRIHVYDIDKDSKEDVREGAAIVMSHEEPVKVQQEVCRHKDESKSFVSIVDVENEAGSLGAKTRDDIGKKSNIEQPKLNEEKESKSDHAGHRDNGLDKGKGKQVECEKPIKTEIKSSPEFEQLEQMLPSASKETESKSKKKRKNKKKRKG
ncbi:hypothetical protein Q5P01_018667 [Channa striata]|uniref:Uncharacterized protein n=1 Tax=Channa striata TaxID=64152 RepID=A0AA88S9E8_CHASR|nr:hypothetical protein Q5P01_018667 [Channa striata]